MTNLYANISKRKNHVKKNKRLNHYKLRQDKYKFSIINVTYTT